jgi:hypothetical protein
MRMNMADGRQRFKRSAALLPSVTSQLGNAHRFVPLLLPPPPVVAENVGEPPGVATDRTKDVVKPRVKGCSDARK